MVLQAGEHVGDSGLRIDIVKLGGLDQGIVRGGRATIDVGSGKGPVAALGSNFAKRSPCEVADDAQPAIARKRTRLSQRLRL
jgi:hypothetical protein